MVFFDIGPESFNCFDQESQEVNINELVMWLGVSIVLQKDVAGPKMISSSRKC